VHHALGRLPDLAYVIDHHGHVAGRVLWSNDARGLERILRAVIDDRRPARPTRYAAIAPLVRGLGMISPILGAAGRSARRDMLITLPPLYVAARAASLFRPLSPGARGVAGLALVLAVALALGAVLRSRRSA
jgi:hypothetical protein